MSAKYGCHNRKDFTPVVTTSHGQTFPFRMAPDCQYTSTSAGETDAKCAGCARNAAEDGKNSAANVANTATIPDGFTRVI